ncbi:EamA family transporter [Photobacterium frigidiphilum]|uniref:EamA family transporter n=1 Tax=Photobacterium frigidiphilum TaxID=264736 RepID=A0A2T3JBY8_9GAMM|nr:DMT family transporter [Photobacterium frigidiphilum]PSU46385.1 EamA family transporter [Photobacterium frigidiphilum]
MTTDLRPVIFMLISTFSLSLNSLLAKFLSDSLSIEMLSFLRFLFPAVLLLWLMALTKWAVPDRKMWQALGLRAFCIAASQLCFLFAINRLSLVETVVLFSTGPLFIPLLEKLLFKTQIQSATLINLAITFTGVLLMAGNTSGVELKPELLVGLGAGVFNAGSQISLYRVSKGSLSPIALNAWGFLLAAVITLPLVLFQTNKSTLQQTASDIADIQTLLSMLILLAVCIVNTQIFRVKAYQLANSSSQLAPLIFTNLIFSSVWQIMFFNQPLEWNKVTGISLIIIATLLNTFLPLIVRKIKVRLIEN